MSSLHPSLPNAMGHRRAAPISSAVHISSIGGTYHLQTGQVDQAFIMVYAEGIGDGRQVSGSTEETVCGLGGVSQ